MAPPRLVPDKITIERWMEEGLTHQQMADRVFKESGNKVTRMAISAAIQRYGLAGEGQRYDDMIPWTIRPSHATAQQLRMLRFLARRNRGAEMNESEVRQLDSWLKKLNDMGAIVAYDPDDDMGFHYIDKKYRDHRDKARPIRVKEISLGS